MHAGLEEKNLTNFGLPCHCVWMVGVRVYNTRRPQKELCYLLKGNTKKSEHLLNICYVLGTVLRAPYALLLFFCPYKSPVTEV